MAKHFQSRWRLIAVIIVVLGLSVGLGIQIFRFAQSFGTLGIPAADNSWSYSERPTNTAQASPSNRTTGPTRDPSSFATSTPTVASLFMLPATSATSTPTVATAAEGIESGAALAPTPDET